MKLEFKFGYIHILKWLVIFRKQGITNHTWRNTVDEYKKHWQNMPTEELMQTRAEHIIDTLRKL